MSEQRKIIPNIHTKVNETIITLNELGDALQPLSDAIYGNATKAMPEDANNRGLDKPKKQSAGGAFNDLEEDVDRLYFKAQGLAKMARELSSLILG
jgi:hypothetical protein